MILFFLIVSLVCTGFSLIARLLLKATIFTGKLIVGIMKFFAKALFVFIVAAIILFVLGFLI